MEKIDECIEDINKQIKLKTIIPLLYYSPDLNIGNFKKNSICLNMIVRNESKILKRMFDSVSSIIDCYCICDTGSTDDTVELIKSYFNEKNIPGKIIYEPFKDFSYNRNFSLINCIGLSEYILFLDADMTLTVKPEFNKSVFDGYDSFTILQGTDDFYYKNTRIVKNNGLYSYNGVTHEYINVPPNQKSTDISKTLLFINDIGDGGSKSDKFERDIRLLKNGILENPNSDRYHFYLANTYFDSGHFDEAIEMYKKRIIIGGWDQEVWYSYYRIGLAYKSKKMMEHAISNWLDAYNFLPKRIECLYEIIEYYRILGKCNLAYSFYKIAKEILLTLNENEKDDFLFLKNDIYKYKLEYELSIISCYVGIKNINEPAMCVFNNSNDDGIFTNTLSNLKFYKDIYKPIMTMDYSNSINHPIENKNRPFNSSSMSIIPTQMGYLMNVRYVNYTIGDIGDYNNCDDYIITINKRVELSKEFKIINEKLIDFKFDNKRYIGVEDLKLFNDTSKGNNNEIIFFGTSLHNDGKIGISYGKYDIIGKYMESVELKQSFNETNCEKNWVSFMNVDNIMNVIYKWYPLQICSLDVNETTGTINIKEEKCMPKIFKHVRGSTNGYKYNKEIWFITHIVSYESPRHYYHLIVVFDENMNLLKYSTPFKFEGICIEYCLSIIVEDNRVIIPYSTWDRTSKLAVYDKSYIDNKLQIW